MTDAGGPLDDARADALFGLAGDAGLALVELTGGGAVLRATPRACALLGQTDAALAGRPLAEVVAPGSRPAFASLLAAGWAAPSTAALEVLREDGGVARALLSVRRAGEGLVVALREPAEEPRPDGLRERGFVEQVLDLMPTPLVLIDPATARVTFANRAADRAAGGSFPRGGPGVRHRYAPLTDAGGRVLDDSQLPSVRASRGERLDGLQYDWHLPDGRVRTVLFYSTMLPEAGGHPATVVMPFLDVTRLKSVEAQLQNAVSARDEFLSVASHELRTPLTTLQLELQGLLRRLAASPEGIAPELLAARLETCMRQVARLTRLVYTLLDLSRLDAGRLEMELTEIDLAEVLGDAVARARPDAARAGCTLTLVAPEPVRGSWDRVRLEQIAENLITNAIKYGGGRPIDVVVEGDSARARLKVTDRGIGIAPEDQARIFERFERAASERNYGGLGLGLWIARQSVHALQGGIWVQSKVSQGATFTVELPRQRRPTTPFPSLPK